ncbi:UNVERIFIED_CONTAM: hypothetical protein FKN15_042107 [Acipenser sinensis]
MACLRCLFLKLQRPILPATRLVAERTVSAGNTTTSPPVRRQWGRRDRPLLHSSLHQDENFHHALFTQHQQQLSLDESRPYSHTSVPPRMLQPAAHPPQQNPIMVELHEQLAGSLSDCTLPVEDASGASPDFIHGYHGDDPRFPNPRRPAYPRVQHSAAPSMLGNVEQTAVSALLSSSSSREFEREGLE